MPPGPDSVPIRVLAIEDEVPLCALYRDALIDAGYAVDTAAGGSDPVLCNAMLTYLDGRELAQGLASADQRPLVARAHRRVGAGARRLAGGGEVGDRIDEDAATQRPLQAQQLRRFALVPSFPLGGAIDRTAACSVPGRAARRSTCRTPHRWAPRAEPAYAPAHLRRQRHARLPEHDAGSLAGRGLQRHHHEFCPCHLRADRRGAARRPGHRSGGGPAGGLGPAGGAARRRRDGGAPRDRRLGHARRTRAGAGAGSARPARQAVRAGRVARRRARSARSCSRRAGWREERPMRRYEKLQAGRRVQSSVSSSASKGTRATSRTLSSAARSVAAA